MKSSKATRLALALALTATVVGGCAAAPDEEGNIGALHDELRGTPVVGATGVIDFVFWDPSGGGHSCTGSMIAPNVVLTAAHCFKSLGSHTGTHSGTTGIVIHYYDPIAGRREVFSGDARWTAVSTFDDGDGASQANDDLAVIQTPRRFTDTSHRDYLRTYSDIGSHLVGKYLTEYGAGIYNYSGDDDERLRMGDLKVTSQDYNHVTIETSTKITPCHGDSGGPLLYYATVEGKKVPTITGVLSNSDKDTILGGEGPHCANNDAPWNNAYYCRTNLNRMKWVEDVTGVTCELQTAGDKDYRRCFKLPLIEAVEGEGRKRGSGAAIAVAAFM